MKKYNVNVNGNLYEITLEVVDGAAPVAAPAAAGAESVNAPMPGTILAVNVTVGQTVNAGDTLMILEAMKMENEISSPKAGKVASIAVTKGANVDSGAVLCVIE